MYTRDDFEFSFYELCPPKVQIFDGSDGSRAKWVMEPTTPHYLTDCQQSISVHIFDFDAVEFCRKNDIFLNSKLQNSTVYPLISAKDLFSSTINTCCILYVSISLYF